MIPLLTDRSLSRDDQHYVLAHLPGLRYSYILNQSLTEAVHLLELGRNVTNRQLLDRNDISLLYDNYPELAHKFNSLRLELDSPLKPSEGRQKRWATSSK